MSRLSLDDFEWVEESFDYWHLVHKDYVVVIAAIRNYNGWLVQVLFDDSHKTPIDVDSIDAAKSVAAIIANQYMEKYSDYFFGTNPRSLRKRLKRDGPPPLRAGVFKVG